MWELLELARVKRSDVENLLEQAKRPIGVEIKYNGNPKRATIIFLRSYETVQAQDAGRHRRPLNAMSPEEYRDFLCGIDRTFKARAGAARLQETRHHYGGVPESERRRLPLICACEAAEGRQLTDFFSTMVLLPRIVDAVAPTLVLAAGGIADARGLAAALCLGTDGVVMGTRFLATHEANVHSVYKARLVTASEEDTVRTILFGHGWPHAPHRTLRTRFVKEWLIASVKPRIPGLTNPSSATRPLVVH